MTWNCKLAAHQNLAKLNVKPQLGAYSSFWTNIITVAARVLATYLIPGCVGRGVRLGSENSSGGGAWAQAWAQVGGPTWGPSGWAHVGPTHEKNGGKFLKIFFTHEKIGGKFLKIFFTDEKMEATS